MALFGSSDGKDDEVARLASELERTELRLEEVSTYYRGELEALRRRSEEELLRVRAEEAGRRRRAEETVGRLNGELNAAQSAAETANRRYHELLGRLEEIEREGEAESRAERDRYQASAKAAWQTAEEEVARLEGELERAQRSLEAERAERSHLRHSYEALEEEHYRVDEQRRQLLARVKRALKLSEQRRRAVEAQLEKAVAGEATRAGRPAVRHGLGGDRAEHEVEVDPTAGWGSLNVGDGGDLADEFLMMGADESFSRSDRAPVGGKRDDVAGATEADGPVGTREAAGAGHRDEVSDDEAEAIMVALDVDQKVAHRQAGRGSGRQRRRSGPAVTPPPREPSFAERWRWVLAGGGALALAVVGVLLL